MIVCNQHATNTRRTARGTPSNRIRSILMAGSLLFAAGVAPAQEAAESRLAVWGEQQKAKASSLKPHEPDRAEALVRRVESLFLESPSGFYPFFSSVYHGGGITVGAGYRKFFGDNTAWNVQGLYSIKNYKLAEGGVESRDHLAKRLSFGTKAGWRDATQVAYYGLGMQTSQDNRTNFRFQQSYADGHATFRPVWWFPIYGALAGEHWEIKQGKGDFPSIETVHTPSTAPGLGSNPSFLHAQVGAGIDYRKPGAAYTRSGGLYRAVLHEYRSNEGGALSFRRLDADVIQHVPLYRETWVLAVRGRAESTLGNTSLVPYFLLPSLGDGDTLRAFDTDRFRDRHSLLFTGEFRWLPSRAVDMAFFYDAGKVASRRGDLNFKGLKSDVGVGMRIHGLAATPLRVDFAVGNEGIKLVISGGPPF